MITDSQIDFLLRRGVAEVIVESEVRRKLKSGRKLRIKHGVDPSGQELHIGHAVTYWKMRELQDLGHTIVFLIGSFTARFGDPTDKAKTRVMKNKDEVEKAAQDYVAQVGKILDLKKTEIRYNSEWYDKMSAEELLHLMSNFTVAQMLERDMFQKRIKDGKDIGLHEPVYPVLQGYDTVILKTDLTVIGTDQKFNELVSRPLQKIYKQELQDVITVPLLPGTDGKMKMSKSLGNYISLTEPAAEQFGKVMSIPDSLIVTYFELATRVSDKRIAEVKQAMKGGKNPRDLKIELGKEIVTLYHGAEAAEKAAAEFSRVFSQKEKPTEMPEMAMAPGEWPVLDILSQAKLIASKAAGRRLVEQGGVKIDDRVVKDWQGKATIKNGTVIQVGKRRFVKIKS